MLEQKMKKEAEKAIRTWNQSGENAESCNNMKLFTKCEEILQVHLQVFGMNCRGYPADVPMTVCCRPYSLQHILVYVFCHLYDALMQLMENWRHQRNIHPTPYMNLQRCQIWEM
jgi:hypothetical protein